MVKNTTKIDRKIAYLFKIRLDSTSKAKVLRYISENSRRFGNKDKRQEKYLIVTPNPEIVLKCLEDNRLKSVINGATISIPDGIGLIQAFKFLSLPKINNHIIRPFVYFFQGFYVGISTFCKRQWLEKDLQVIHGRILFEEIIRLANKKGLRLAFLGGGQEVAQKSSQNIAKSYKKVKILALTGPILDEDAHPVDSKQKDIEAKAIAKINAFGPHILFLGFGAPKQEKWADKWINRLNVGGIMVVGGVFDYYASKVKIPPKWISERELEWFWRLLTQKGRLKRVLMAFPVFPLKVFKFKLGQ